jgi:hypothetical protein
MKNLKNFCTTLALICALASPVAGQTTDGQIDVPPGAPAPCKTEKDPGQIDVPPCTLEPDPGQIDVPPGAPSTDLDPLTQLAADVIWGLLSII